MKKVVMSCLLALVFVTFFFVALVISGSSGKVDPNAGMTKDDWASHKKDLLVFSLILKEPNVNKMFAMALSSKESLSGCKKAGCGEARYLLKEVIGAAEDGIITPKEAQELIAANKFFRKSVYDYDARFK